MTEAVCAQKSPYAVDLAPGEYDWCACGRSANQPFCDGSHAGTDITPVAFTVAEAGTKYLCGCKSTGNQPFCDGTHSKI